MSDSFFWDPKRQWPQTDATDSQVGEQQLDSTRSTLFTNSASDLQSEQSTLISELSDTLDPRAFSYPLPRWKMRTYLEVRAPIGVHPTKTCPGALPHLLNTKFCITTTTTPYDDRLPNSHLPYIVPPGIVYIPN
jgi:hypothetical protein